jgi:hypothetical protein
MIKGNILRIESTTPCGRYTLVIEIDLIDCTFTTEWYENETYSENSDF